MQAEIENLRLTLESIINKIVPWEENIEFNFEVDNLHGDFNTNIALVIAQKQKDNPQKVAKMILDELIKSKPFILLIEKAEVAGPGFINFTLKNDVLFKFLQEGLDKDQHKVKSQFVNKKYLIEFAHPNTHKEFHIGHMRTL